MRPDRRGRCADSGLGAGGAPPPRGASSLGVGAAEHARARLALRRASGRGDRDVAGRLRARARHAARRRPRLSRRRRSASSGWRGAACGRRCAGFARARRCCATPTRPGCWPGRSRESTQAAAQAGEPDLARQTVAELERTPLGHKGFEFELGLARAWSAAAAGEHSRARALARETSELTQSRGQDGYTVRALHELCRLGDAASGAPRLARARRARSTDRSRPAPPRTPRPSSPATGPLFSTSPSGSPTEGALLRRLPRPRTPPPRRFAMPVATRAPARRRRAPPCCSTPARARDHRRCWAGKWSDELTRREREIAVLAASGLSSRQIAERLVVSVRTVDNHLQRAYRKLGVTRRQDLAQVLGGAPE